MTMEVTGKTMDQGFPVLGVMRVHFDPDFTSLLGYPPFEEFRRPKESAGGS